MCFLNESKSVLVLQKVKKLGLLCCIECFILLECKVHMVSMYSTCKNLNISMKRAFSQSIIA